jgi:hypothetical protein
MNLHFYKQYVYLLNKLGLGLNMVSTLMIFFVNFIMFVFNFQDIRLTVKTLFIISNYTLHGNWDSSVGIVMDWAGWPVFNSQQG